MPSICQTVFLCLLISFSSFSQSIEDSLKQALYNTDAFDEKAEISLELTKIYKRINIDSSFKYLQIAEELTPKHTNAKLKARFLLAKGNYFQNTGSYEESLEYYHKAIDDFEKLNDINSLAKSYNSLGLTYKKISGDANEVREFSQKALEYEYKALGYYEQSKDYEGLIQAYNNIGIILRDIKDFDGAEKVYLKGLSDAKKHKFDTYNVGILKANLSQIYLDHYKDYDKAIALLNEALLNYKKNGVRSSMEHSYRNLSYNYAAKKDYPKAIFYANKAVEIANEVKDPHRQVNAYTALHHAQKMAGLYQESLASIEFVNNLEDSLFSIEKSKIIAELNSKFDSVKKDAEIKILSKTNQVNTWRIWALLTGLMAVLALAVLVLLKRKKDGLIHEQAQAIEIQKRQHAEAELDAKKKELTAKVLQLAHKNEFLTNLESEVSSLKTGVDSSISQTSNKISKMIRRDIDSDRQWQQFSEEFSSLHRGFLSRLAEKYGTFTKTEVRLISLLKMNLNSKEIADIMGISVDGVKKARYRLRKKLNLEDSELQGYLLSFA